MTGTDRIGVTKSSPSTSFYLSANELAVLPAHIAGNYTVVRCYIRAVNAGNTSSLYGNVGSQIGQIDGVGTFANHTTNPFLPSGYGTGALRWEDGPYDVVVPHNAAGDKAITLRMILDYGSIYQELTAGLTLTTLKGIPSTPTGVTGARESDTSVTVAWAQSSPSNSQPTSNTVRRKINGGAWADVVTVAPTTSVAFGAAENQKLVYGVKASNSAGASAWSDDSTPIYTTPAAPSDVIAVKDSALDIAIAFTPHVAFTEHEHVIVHGTVSGGVTTWDGSALAVLTAGTTGYTHNAPNPANVHIYKVYARNTDTGALMSSEVASNSVQLLAAPNKPTLPTIGPFVDKSKALAFAWTHNPVDTTAQSAYEVEYSTNGGSSWSSTGKVASATASKTFAADSYASGVQLTLRVRTWGQAASGGSDSTGASPWSDQATVTFKTRPVATIIAPADEGVYDRSALNVQLGFAQVEGAVFVNATIELFDGATRLEQRVSTTLASTALTTRVANGGEYTVKVTVRDSNGLVSDQVTAAFDVAYTEPVAAVVTVVYLEDSGIGQLDVAIAEAGVGEATAVSVSITRSIGGSVESVVEQYPAAPSITILDMTPTIYGDNVYTVRTISADGATTDVVTTLTTAEEEWAFMSKGLGFEQIVRFGGDLKPQATPTVDSALFKASGRQRPIGQYGTTGDLVVSGTGEVVTGLGSSAEEIEAFLLVPGKGCYRDPTGRRMFGRITGQVSRDTFMLGSFPYTVTETS